jgi:nickel superoxide dismutase
MNRSMLLTSFVAAVLLSVLLVGSQRGVNAHCEIPCGIYDDPMRIRMMLEDCTTISRAMDEINRLAGAHDAQASNQLARWILNKEIHADKIQETIATYFLSQRVKPKAEGSDEYEDYVQRLVDHHAVIVAAMKAKQSADPQAAVALKGAIEKVGTYYPQPEAHSHSH